MSSARQLLIYPYIHGQLGHRVRGSCSTCTAPEPQAPWAPQLQALARPRPCATSPSHLSLHMMSAQAMTNRTKQSNAFKAWKGQSLTDRCCLSVMTDSTGLYTLLTTCVAGPGCKLPHRCATAAAGSATARPPAAHPLCSFGRSCPGLGLYAPTLTICPHPSAASSRNLHAESRQVQGMSEAHMLLCPASMGLTMGLGPQAMLSNCDGIVSGAPHDATESGPE